MRIFYFSGASFPSSEARAVHVVKMCEAFGKAGHEVTLFAMGNPNMDTRQIFKSYDVGGHFKLSLSKDVKIPLLSNYKRLKHISEQMKNFGRPDMVYGRDPVALALYAPQRIPMVFEATRAPSSKAEQTAIAKLIKKPGFSGIVALSDALKQDLLKRFPVLKPEQIFVAHDAADVPHNISGQAEAITPLKGRKDATKVGYAGTLHQGKGISMILKVAPLLPDCDFHVLGGTKAELEKIARTNPSGNIIFHGHKPHAEVAGMLKSFDILLAPYQHAALIKTGKNISRWISPMKVFEYMAAGRPMVASDLSILREFLTHGENALLVNAGEPLEWVAAIQALRKNPELGQEMARKAFADLKNNFTWDKRAETVLDFAGGKRTSIIASRHKAA